MVKIRPGDRLPAPTQQGILFKSGKPVLGFASMSAGLHQRTFQNLLNYTQFGMSLRDSVDAPAFYMPAFDLKTGVLTLMVPEGRFDKAVLDATGYKYEEVDSESGRLKGKGTWVAISRDPVTGRLEAVSDDESDGSAEAY